MTKAIIFDCFGVLTADTWHEFTMSLPADQAAQARSLNRAYDSGMISLQDFLTGVQDATGKKPKLVEEMLDKETSKNTALLSYIADLKNNYKISLVSNIGTNWIRESFLSPDEQALFDDIVLSFEVGMTKPDPAIYELACKRIGVEPTETIVIDDIERNCEVAKSIGMEAIQYQDFMSMKSQLENILAADSNN